MAIKLLEITARWLVQTHWSRVAPVVFVILVSGLTARAQVVQVQVARGPYYVGDPIEIQIVATEFEEDPAPTIMAGPIDGAGLRFAGVSPSTSTSISIINGSVSRVHEVKFVYQYELVGTEAGSIRVPEFTLTQGAIARTTKSFDLAISGVPTTTDVAIKIELPDGPIFVGQKVSVAIEFRISRQTQRDLISYQVHVPLFDSPALRFLDDPSARSDTKLEIQTDAGVLHLPAISTEETIRGRPSLVVRATRTMIAISPGELVVDAAKVFVSQGTNFRRDLFNQRRATSAQKMMASDRPIRIEVGEVPRRDRPASFAGAVGSGFSLEVAADRSVVQLGEPISLSFVLRGDGDLSTASLPPLDAEGLFDTNQFRIPEDSPAGIVDEVGKHFELTLRVLDAGVREIPALAYSWFDAETRQFATTYSRPIALSVGAAEIIGADAVARRLDATVTAPDDATKASDAFNRSGGDVERSTSLRLTGANLAVARELDGLLRNDREEGGNGVRSSALYGIGLAFLVFAIIDARRRSADPILAARAKAFARAERNMQEAFGLPRDEAGAELGRVLRELLAAYPTEAGPDFDVLIAECDTLRFARSDSSAASPREEAASLPASLQERARQLLADRRQSGRRKSETP